MDCSSADWKSVTDLAAYEGFTPLERGARYDGTNSKLDRDAAGRVIFSWKSDTPPLPSNRQFYYNVKMEVMQNGQLVSQTQRAVITPGQPVQVDFNGSAVTTEGASGRGAR